MAKFTDYTQKTKPADADLLLIHDNAGAANKKTPFSGVWSWILDKLASAVISQLETTNKSIIPAINELNSKILIGENKRYIKVVSNSSDLNWGGILLATGTNMLLVSLNGTNAPRIIWSAISSGKITVNSGENNPLETIIDTSNPQSHILVIPFGLISKSRIAITD